DLSVLGVIPQLTEEQRATMGEVGLISQAMPRSLPAEAYKALRTNLEFLRRNQRLEVIMVTSPTASDGKSTTSSNLAISLAHAGRRVLLVDADLRKPSLDSIYGLRRDRGLSHVLRDLMPMSRVVQRTSVENLDFIATGPEVPNPAELLMSARLGEF